MIHCDGCCATNRQVIYRVESYVVQVRVQEVGVLVIELVQVFRVLCHHLIILFDEADVKTVVILLKRFSQQLQEGCNCKPYLEATMLGL